MLRNDDNNNNIHHYRLIIIINKLRREAADEAVQPPLMRLQANNPTILQRKIDWERRKKNDFSFTTWAPLI